MADAVKFFEETNEPVGFVETNDRLKHFISRHVENGSPLVLVTSGGTTVPLEGNTVRFIDNFSIGTRGSASAEYFLEHGYAVIFLHRHRSLEPFTRHLPQHHLLDILDIKTELGEEQLQLKPEYTSKLLTVVQKYKQVREEGRLLVLDFTSLVDYLHLLKACSQALDVAGKKVCLYLAAAVSDFYIPNDKMPQHKIQSSSGPLQLCLELVPKMLEALVKKWIKLAFVVSFKLETDPDLLIGKSYQAIEKYQHQLVIGNILATRKREVVLVPANMEAQWIQLDQSDIDKGVEIEAIIVNSVIDRHKQFCNHV